MFRKQFENSPVAVRVAPFVVFLLLTYCQGKFGEASRYWFYLAKTLVGAWLLFEMRPFVAEMRAAFSWEAVVVGVGVCVLWIGLDGFYPKLSELSVKVGLSKAAAVPALPWNPHLQFGDGAMLAWFFIAVRMLGSSLVVPALEEVFFRSFLYRYIAKADFQSVALGTFAALPFFVTSAVFAFEHEEWLAGILCGFAFQGLVIWKKRLGDAIVAHGITNFLLGVWVVWKGAWQFW
ncbi:MAG: CAAX prenyl protease-related protein [Pedosphaera sp.]|nr:CAAX prenyl protease-related protein [Pedosphaera sp.]